MCQQAILLPPEKMLRVCWYYLFCRISDFLYKIFPEAEVNVCLISKSLRRISFFHPTIVIFVCLESKLVLGCIKS